MANKEMKSNKDAKKNAPQAGKNQSKGRNEPDSVEKQKASDTQSEFNMNERRQEQFKEQ